MSTPHTSHPQTIVDVTALEELLSRPTQRLLDSIARSDGDFIVLGVGGKMGPTLARMLRRAVDAAGKSSRVIGVSRFTTPALPAQLGSHGVEPITCDLLNPADVDRLPDVPNVIFMAGMKFGTTGQQSRTWAMNTYLPAVVSQRYRRSRIVVFSTGNVYPMVPVETGGSLEASDPEPLGEYAMSCLGRERIFEHFSRTLGIPMAFIRLSYAVEMRYGVVVDMAQRIAAGASIDLTMGSLNAIWQGDANAMSLCALEHVATPPFVVNVTGPQPLKIREVSTALGREMGIEPSFTGVESGRAYLANAELCRRLYGEPVVAPPQFIRWTADWVKRGGATLGKPTHFETRDGKY